MKSIIQKISKYKADNFYMIDDEEDKRFILIFINNNLEILDNYSKFIYNSVVYYIAIIINLSLKLQFFLVKSPAFP